MSTFCIRDAADDDHHPLARQNLLPLIFVLTLSLFVKEPIALPLEKKLSIAATIYVYLIPVLFAAAEIPGDYIATSWSRPLYRHLILVFLPCRRCIAGVVFHFRYCSLIESTFSLDLLIGSPVESPLIFL